MRSREGSVLDTLLRVQSFLDTNAGQLGSISTSGARKMLDDSIAALSGHALDQSAGLRVAKGATGEAQALRTALRENHMRPISAIARAKLRDVPKFRSLALPPANRSDQRLIADADAMAEAAGPFAQVFVDAGMPQDFLAQLMAAKEAFAGTRVARDSSRSRRAGGTKGLGKAAQAGRQALKVLDSFLVPAFGTADHLVAQWRSLRRVDAKPGRTSRAAGSSQGAPGGSSPGAPTTPGSTSSQQQGTQGSPSSPTAPATPVASSAGEGTTTPPAVPGPVAQAA